jgi:hypothetical protein
MAKLEILRKPHAVVIVSEAKQSLLKRKIASLLVAPRNDTARPVYRSIALRVAMFAYLILVPTLALAHGGMGPDEIGPPIVTSGLIGFACYWLVMLWPSSRKGNIVAGSGTQSQIAPQTRKRSRKNSAQRRRIPRLRKIEGSGQFDNDQTSRRRVNNG